ncbi:hypothetical protein CCP4SC76_7240003 [Gammaproteobacteria bacterium]
MSSLEEMIIKLKDSMASARDIQEPSNIFFDQVIKDPAFMRIGKKTKATKIAPVIEMLGQKYFHQNGKITNVMAFAIQKFKLTHGTCFMDGNLVVFFYAEDLDIGLAATMNNKLKTDIFRFTLLELEKPVDESAFVSNPGSVHWIIFTIIWWIVS